MGGRAAEFFIITEKAFCWALVLLFDRKFKAPIRWKKLLSLKIPKIYFQLFSVKLQHTQRVCDALSLLWFCCVYGGGASTSTALIQYILKQGVEMDVRIKFSPFSNQRRNIERAVQRQINCNLPLFLRLHNNAVPHLSSIVFLSWKFLNKFVQKRHVEEEDQGCLGPFSVWFV